jgi:hypothetical protein
MTVQNEVAGSRRRANWYGRAPGTPEDREFALRAVYHHFPDQEVLDGLHEQLRQRRVHFAWLESEGHPDRQGSFFKPSCVWAAKENWAVGRTDREATSDWPFPVI